MYMQNLWLSVVTAKSRRAWVSPLGGHGDHVTAHLRSRGLQAGGIWVEREWKAAEGVRLTQDLVLGKILGSGFQVLLLSLCLCPRDCCLRHSWCRSACSRRGWRVICIQLSTVVKGSMGFHCDI